MFIHLRVFSHNSILNSSLRIKDIVGAAKKYKMQAIALSDFSNMRGMLEFSNKCIENSIKPINGISIVIRKKDAIGNEKSINAAFYAKNSIGLKNLIKINYISYKNSPSEPYLTLEDVKNHSNGIIAIIGAKDKITSFYEDSSLKDFCTEFKKFFGDRFYLEIQRYSDYSYEDLEEKILNIALEQKIEIVGTNSTYFLSEKDKKAHNILLCISDGKYINSKDKRISIDDFRFKSQEEMKAIFADIPMAYKNSEIIATRCSAFIEESKPKIPKYCSGNEFLMLKKESENGLQKRISECLSINQNYFSKNKQEEYHKRLEYELSILEKIGYSGYLLIVSDFIKFAKKKGIPVGPGRGSGAGSLIVWSLEITDIDPIYFGLVFERFLNPERISMPDIDVDFCQERRDEVIEYVASKYGQKNVAHITTMGTLQPRAVIRDVGRVLQFSYSQVDKISKMIPNNPANPLSLQEAIEVNSSLKNLCEQEETKELMEISLKIEGLYRHASVHAAGLVISDSPLDEKIPLYFDQDVSLPITQFNMKYVEASGFVKFDFLGLKTLTLIELIQKTIKQRGVREENLLKDLYSEKKAFELLSTGSTMGIFQLEARAMQDALRIMKPNNIEDIVALISLNRPGPMENIGSYIERKHGNDKVTYPHKDLEKILEETFGIMIYQEQVMKAAQIMAGYKLGEADLLRRAMGKKIKSEMKEQKNIFIKKAVELGHTKKIAEEVFSIMEKFAGYGFNKSHAAAYAVISYQTAFLKAIYTIEFFVSCLNLEINNTDKIFLFIQEISKHGIKIEKPCINKSLTMFAISEDETILYSLAACKGIGIGTANSIIAIREQCKNKKFSSLQEFLTKCGKKILNKKVLERLVYSGSLSALESNQEILVGNIEYMLSFIKEASNFAGSNFQKGFFNNLKLEALNSTPVFSKDKCKFELDSFGFYLTKHPLAEFGSIYQYPNIKRISDAINCSSESNTIYKVLASIDSVKIGATKGKKFVKLIISDEKDFLDLRVYHDSKKFNDSVFNLLQEGNICFFYLKTLNNGENKKIFIENVEKFTRNNNKKKQFYLNIEINNKMNLRELKKITNKFIASDSTDDDTFAIEFIINLDSQEKLKLKSRKIYMKSDILIQLIKKIEGVIECKFVNSEKESTFY